MIASSVKGFHDYFYIYIYTFSYDLFYIAYESYYYYLLSQSCIVFINMDEVGEKDIYIYIYIYMSKLFNNSLLMFRVFCLLISKKVKWYWLYWLCVLVSVVLTGWRGVSQQCCECTGGSAPTVQTSIGDSLQTEIMLNCEVVHRRQKNILLFLISSDFFFSRLCKILQDCYNSLCHSDGLFPPTKRFKPTTRLCLNSEGLWMFKWKCWDTFPLMSVEF